MSEARVVAMNGCGQWIRQLTWTGLPSSPPYGTVAGRMCAPTLCAYNYSPGGRYAGPRIVSAPCGTAVPTRRS